MFIRFIDGIQQPYSALPTGPRGVQSVSPVAGASSAKLSDDSPQQGSPALPHKPRNPYQVTDALRDGRSPAIVVRQIMSAPVVTMAPGQPLFFAEELFTKRRFRHIPVVNMHGKPVGIVSDRDILRAYVKGHDQDVRVEPINTIMSKNVLTVFTDTAIRDAARVLFQERIGCLPVVDDQNVIIGLVTRSDILRTIITTVPLELWI